MPPLVTQRLLKRNPPSIDHGNNDGSVKATGPRPESLAASPAPNVCGLRSISLQVLADAGPNSTRKG